MFTRGQTPRALNRGLGRLRGGRRMLGCQACSGKRLGQDDGDVFSTTYDPLSTSSPTFNVPSASVPSYSGDYSGGSGGFSPIISSDSNPYNLPGLTDGPVYPANMTPAQALQYDASGGQGAVSSSGLVTGINAAGAALKSLVSPSSTPFILGSGAPGAASSSTAAALNSYMPLIILGLGGIALIAVLKKR
jgi:hypothetical protein